MPSVAAPLGVGVLFSFQHTPGRSNVERVRFDQEFWGRTTSSWSGRYQHHRRGFMDDVPHVKLRAGVFLTPLADADRVRAFLEPRVARLVERRVLLEAEDARAFGKRRG